MNKKLIALAVFGALTTVTAQAFADEAAAPAAAPAAAAAPVPNWTFPGSVGLVSDYLWHGQTQTWGKPALQAGIEVDHVSGLYAGVWGSNVSSHWLENANLETDWSVGYRNTFATDFRYDVGGTYIYYPGGNFNKSAAAIKAGTAYNSSKLNTVELYASLGWKWFTVKGGYNPTKFYGWNNNNSGIGGGFAGDNNAGVKVNGDTAGSGYVVGSASYDIPKVEGLNLAGEVGHQMISDSTNLDWTWYKIGLTKSFDGGWAINGAYSGTTGTKAYRGFNSLDLATDTKTIDKDKVVVTLSKSF